MILKLEIEKQFPTSRDVAQLLWDNAILCEQMRFKFRPVVIGDVVIRPQTVDTDYIISKACQHFNVPYEVLQSKTRKREVVQARQIAMYFSKNLTKESLASIGKKIGNKDHATVLHANKTVTNLMETDKKFNKLVEDFERCL